MRDIEKRSEEKRTVVRVSPRDRKSQAEVLRTPVSDTLKKYGGTELIIDIGDRGGKDRLIQVHKQLRPGVFVSWDEIVEND